MRRLQVFAFASCCTLVLFGCHSTGTGEDHRSAVGAARASKAAQTPELVLPPPAEDHRADDGARWVPGRLLVRFRDTLLEPADVVHRHGLRFAAAARSGGADLDRLQAKYRVRAVAPLFASAFEGAIDAPGRGALAERRKKLLETVRDARARFPERAARAGRRAADVPDLTSVYVVEVPEDTDVARMAEEYAANPNVEYAVPDQLARVQALPNDPYLVTAGSWGQPYADLWALAKIGAPPAWDVATGLGVVVAVVDTGLDLGHVDIAANVWANAAEAGGAPGVDDDGNGFVDDVRGWDFAYGDANPADGSGHGTHVAGTIAAVGDNGVGVVGVAHQARIMALKGLDDGGYGAFSGLAKAIVYAARNGADVISNSWGCAGCTDASLIDSVALARSLGCVTTFAAGNNNADVKGFFPASLQDTLTVASSGADDSKSSFSNWGFLVDVAAPGGGPAAATPGAAFRNILSLRAAGTGDPSLAVGDVYLRQAGTSMATPHVSGVAALLLSANPALTVAEVESIVRHTAADGVGSPDLDTPGYDPYYGWGRLDAAAAVASAFAPPADPASLKVRARPLEFDVPSSACPGQQWALGLDVYNLGGGTLSWSSSGPGWLAMSPASGTAPAFPAVVVDAPGNASGVLAISSPQVPGEVVELPVALRTAADVTIANCDAALARAYSTQDWDPLRNWRAPAIPDGSGGAYHVWTDTRNGNPDIYVQHVDALGYPLWGGDGIALTSAWPGAEIRPAIAADGSGGALVAWAQGANDGDVVDKVIHVQRVNAAGEKLWAPDGVSLGVYAGGQIDPTIVADGAGGAIVAWTDYRSGEGDIYAQRVDAHGYVRWIGGGVPLSRAVDAQFDPEIASDGFRGAIVTWVDRRTGYWAIHAQRVDLIGQVRWTADGVRVGPSPSLPVWTSASGPNVVADGAGGAILAWHDFRNLPLNPSGVTFLNRSEIYAARLNADGESAWAAGGVPVVSGLTVGPGKAVPGYHPDQVTMTPDGSGGVLVVWHDARSGESWDVYTQRLDSLGNRLWGTRGVPVTAAWGDQLSPSVAADGEGGAIYAWADTRPGHEDVFVQRLGPTGAPLAAKDGVWIEGKPGDQWYPHVVPLAAGRFHVTWDDWSNCAGAYCVGTGIDRLGKTIEVALPSRAAYPLTVVRDGDGAGTVTSSPAGIACGSACWAEFPAGATVTLVAEPVDGSVFTGWTGACAGATATCTVTMDAARTVGATFRRTTYDLTVQTTGTGRGTVAGGGISCTTGSTAGCTAAVPSTSPATVVTLTATPEAGSALAGWSGCTTASGNVCTVSMAGARTVTATFQPALLLTVKTYGTGVGTVTGEGVSCTTGSTVGCTAYVPSTSPATEVALTATPSSTSIFTSWSGCTSVVGNVCTVSMTGARTVSATFQPATWLLTAKTYGTGWGTVTGEGVACTTGSTTGCTASVPNTSPATVVTLTAQPEAGSIFTSWSGCTTVVGNVCTVTMTGARTATATFQPATWLLTVKPAGAGRGTVTGEGISCTTGAATGCATSVSNTSPATTVTLTATATAGSVFWSWSGCTSVSGNVCTVAMTMAKTVTATFQPATWPLTVNTAGSGRGTVTGEGISCTTGATAGCTASVPNTSPATAVTLTATPQAGSMFWSWSGCTSVSGNVCTVSMTMAKTVRATFQPATWPLTVSMAGTGRGTVAGGGISCTSGSTAGCTTPVPTTSPATAVTLTATPQAGSVFWSWSGCTSVSGNVCTVSMTGAKTVTATFQPDTWLLTVSTTGTGQGTVSGGGISCTTGSTAGCTTPVPTTSPATTVTLTATPHAGSLFWSWSGCASVSGNVCTVTMTGAKTVAATFQPDTWLLTAKTAGTGYGTVTGPGISCTTGSAVGCTTAVPTTSPATSVTLTAAPQPGSIFTTWSGCSSVSGNVCTVAMTMAKTVTATFQPATWPLTVKTAGAGRGTVTGDGISCTTGATAGCSATVPNTSPATAVALTAAPETGSVFSSWSGCSSVSGSVCTVSMTMAKTVTATFQPATWPLTVKTAGAGRGTVTGDGISCTTGATAGCSATVPNTSPATAVALTAAPETGFVFSSWSGCSSVSGSVCTVSMTMAKTVTATFYAAPAPLTVTSAGASP
jgi:subtilisin family serine protease